MQLAVVFEGLDHAENLPREVTYYIRPMTGEETEWFTGLTYPFLRLNVPSTTGPGTVAKCDWVLLLGW